MTLEKVREYLRDELKRETEELKKHPNDKATQVRHGQLWLICNDLGFIKTLYKDSAGHNMSFYTVDWIRRLTELEPHEYELLTIRELPDGTEYVQIRHEGGYIEALHEHH